jgi:D-glycero-D-manno-heptose 1,7-bisphosphate phosphatase
VVSLRPQRLGDIPKRLAAVRAFSALPEAASLAAANKRVGNILKKVEGTWRQRSTRAAQGSRRSRAARRAGRQSKPQADAAFLTGDYTLAAGAGRAEAPRSTAFFDDVMVNAEDPPCAPTASACWPRCTQAMNQVVADLSKAFLRRCSAQSALAARRESHETRHPRPRRRHQLRFRPVHQEPGGMEADPGSLEAIAKLNQAGYRVVIATNQSGVGRGLFDMDTLNSIHEKMHKALFTVGGRVDAVFYCPHTADSDCACRKPFKRISEIMNTDLKGVPAIGDSLARPAGRCRCRLLAAAGADRQGTKTLAEGNLPAGTREFANLEAAVDWLLAGKKS